MLGSKSFGKLIALVLIITSTISAINLLTNITAGSTLPFVLDDETEKLLDEEYTSYYNGSISVTVTLGVGVNATVNGVTKEVLLGETKDFTITKTHTIVFILSTYGYTEGSFYIELNIGEDPDGNPIRKTIGIVAIILLVFSVISYYIRSKRMEPKDDDDGEEEVNPEVAKRRKEAAGAEKRYLGLDDEI
ncbi:MAG: hypothetical protein ACTSSH_07915 [Candidatus Heimdallarchaeota archaeon]